MSVVIMIDSTYVVSPDFNSTVVPEGYIWDETAFAELVKATDKATAAETIYTYGGPQGDAETDFNNNGDLTISDQKYNGEEGQVVGTTVTANAFNNTGTVTTDGAIVFSVKSFTNSGEFDLDKTGSLTATSAVTNMADGTINLNAGSTLQGSTVVNGGTITVVSDHAAINGAISNHGTIDATKRKLIVVGDLQNANEDDTAEARDNTVITAREFEVTGNVVNYGILGTEMQPDHQIDISGELRNYRQIEVGILTAGSIYSDGYYPEIEEKCTRGYIIAGEVNAGSIDNVSGVIQTAAPKETGVGINVTGTINNGNTDGIIAKINAGLNGWIQAASLNNLGNDIENENGLIIAGKLTVADIVNNGGISTRIVESTGTITNDAAGLFAVTYIDDPTVTGLVEGASLTAGTIINGGTFAVCSEADLPTPVTVTSIENSGLFEFTGVGFTLTGDIFNKTEGQLDVAGTVTGGTGSITNSGTLNISNADDVSGVLTIDGAVKNAKTGTINLNAGTTLQGTTIGNAGTITVVSDHATINGAITNHSLIDSVMKTLNVTGDIRNANEDDMREARNSSIIKVRNLNVTGNVTNYGVIGTEWQEANDITISGDLRNFHQIIVNKTLTANSVYQDYIDSEVEEKRCVGYIICGQVIAGEINNASGEISAGADKDAGIAIEATGKITNGKADAIFSATLQAGDDGCIQAVDALNNIGAASTVHAGYITVLKGTEAGDLTNDGIIQTKSITVDGSVTNSATGSIEIDGASTESGNLSGTSIGNAGTLNLNGPVTLAGDVANSNLLNFQGAVTATGAITNTETGAINIKSAGSIAGSVDVTNSGTLHIAILEGNETKITADKFYNTEGVGKITIGGSCDDGITTVISATEGDVNVSDITVSATAKSGGEVTAVTRGGNVAIASGVDYGTIYLSNGIDEAADFAKEVKDSAGASFYVDFTAFKLPASALTDGVRDTTATILIDGTNAAALQYESETTASIDGLAFAKDGTNAATPEDEEKNVEFTLTGMDPAAPESYRDLKKGITVGAGVTLTADKLRQTGEDAVTNIDGELRIGTYDTGYDAFLIAGGTVNVNSTGALTGNGIVIVDAAQRDEAGDPIKAALNVTGAAVDLSDLELGANATVTLKDIALNADSSSRAVIDSIALWKTDVVDFADPVLTISDSHVTANTVKIEAGATLTVSCSAPGSSDLTVNGMLDFDISGAAAGGPALFEGLDHVLGAPSYTLTISGTEGKGTYSLATGAAGFDRSFTVVNTLGTELGTISVNGAELNVDGKTYKLALNGSDLSVSIAFGNKPDDGSNDILYDKKTKKWNDENITVKTQITAAGDFVSLDEAGSVEESVHGLVMHNMVGYNTPKCDTGDTARIAVDAPAKLTFQIDSTVSGTFYMYEKVYDEKKKAYEQVQVGKVSVKKDKPAFLKDVCITADGDYFVQMAANAGGYKKAGATGFYNVKVASAKFFDAVDDGWNDAYTNPLVQANPVRIDREIPFVALDDNVLSDRDWNFVGGITDEADYARLQLDDSAYLSFNVIGDDAASDGAAKFTVWQRNGSKGLKKLTSVTLKSGSYEQTTTGVFLDKDGEYYISMESTDAAKGKAVSYKVEVNKLDSRIFDSADDGLNNELYDKKNKAIYPDDGATHHYLTNVITVGSRDVFLDYDPIGLEGYENFVGYGDKADYAKFTVTEQGRLSFTVTATEGATFEVWMLANGKMKSLGKAKLKLDTDETVCTGTVSNLSLEVGTEYYVSMTASKTTANAKGSVFYNVSATLTPQNASSLSMPETASAASALSLPDALSFGSCDTDALANASASSLAELDDKTGWQSLLA